MDDESGSAVLTAQESRRARTAGREKCRELAVIPLKSVPEVVEILKSVLDASRKEVHTAISRILHAYPGHKRREAWNCLRSLRRDRGKVRGQHAVWSEVDLRILRAGYAEGLAGIRRARKTLLERHPDWNECVIDYKAAELSITKHRPKPEPWQKNQENELLKHAEEMSVRQIAARVGRSEPAVRTRMSLLGLGGRVRLKRGCTLRETAYIFGIGPTTLRRYAARGLIRVSRIKNGYRIRYISHENIEKFYRQYPDKVKNPERTRDMIDLWHYDREDEEKD
ncbi:MAG TPA: hypothetical protein VMI06_06065 [Terriglobia bacterium]|nr:hypothetical protein [Terriglobia bacterium]